MWLHLTVLFTCLAIGTPSFAHGTGQHVLGTVIAIDTTHLEVKTPKGKNVEVQLNHQTKFRQKGSQKNAKLPLVGDRVVIEATKINNVLTATDVYYASGKRALIPVESSRPQ